MRAAPAAPLFLAAALTACGPPEPHAIAVPQDDGALMLVAGTFDRSCEEALSLFFQCGRWELFVHLGAPDQTPGAKSLASSSTWALRYFSDGAYDGEDCTIYGDEFTQGTVEITSRSDDSVSFELAGTTNDAFDADGAYEAALCDPQ